MLVGPHSVRLMSITRAHGGPQTKRRRWIALLASAVLLDGGALYGRASSVTRVDAPLSIVLAIDTGSSIHLDMEHLREGLRQFVNRIESNERVEICTFGDRLQCAPFTRAQRVMFDDIKALPLHDDARVFDSLDRAIDELRDADGRRVVVVFAMKPDWRWSTSPKHVLKDAQRHGVAIYAVGLDVRYYDGDDFIDGRPDPELEHLVRESGGKFFEVTNDHDIASAFAQLAKDAGLSAPRVETPDDDPRSTFCSSEAVARPSGLREDSCRP